MPIPDWQTNDSTNHETISEYDFVNCIYITSKKTEFDKLKVRDLSLIDPYSDISLTVVNILKAKDISVDEIELENHIDTDGVIEFIKPIYVENAGIQEIRAYDGSFSSISVENRLDFSVIEAKTDNIITINSDASFYNNIQSNDICVNIISNRIDGEPIHIMCDVSINKKLNVEDISVSHINNLYNTIVFNSDVSMKDVLYASDFSGEVFRARELSANNIYGSNDRIEFIADISNNNIIKIQEISLNTLGKHESKITIMNNLLVDHDLKIGGELSLNNLYTDNQYINFNDNSIFTYGIVKPDISINIINPSEPPKRGIQTDQSNILIINADVSFNSSADLDWVNSAFNVIAPYDSINEVINKNNEFVIGSLVEIRITDDNNKSKINIYIKIDDDSWHILVDANNSPWYKQFTLSYEGIDMLIDDRFKQDIPNTIIDNQYITTPENSITDISVGVQDYVSDLNFSGVNTIKFYVKKIKSEEDHTYNLRTVVEDLELDSLTLRRRDNTNTDAINALAERGYMNSFSDFCYNYGGGWEVRLSTGGVLFDDQTFQENVTHTELSNLDIKVPINNGFDASFILEVRDDVNITLNPKLIYIIKVNEVPTWTEFKLDASNGENYLHKGTQLIDKPSEHERLGLVGMYNDISFDVSYDKPTISNNRDVSYYNLDLSAIDPEGFDVSYYIEDKADFNDWSWNWSADNSNMLKIKVPGEGINGIDVSLVILVHDNNVPDVSNLIPNDLYREDGIETSYNRTIITFRKENAQPIWNCIKLGVSNDQFDELDQSWNDNIDEDGNRSHQFYVYFEPDKKYVQQKNENFSTDLSSYFLDLSSTDPEGFDSSYYVLDPKSDISHIITNDYSRIQIDISSLLTTYDTEHDMSLEIVSQDDWSYNFADKRDHSRIYNTRILNFKHISSRLLEEIEYQDISSTTDSQLYNVNDNSYEILYSKQNKDMQITLSFDYNQFEVALTDLSIVNTKFSEYDISLVRQGNHNVIDISGIDEVYTDNNSGYIDFSFDLLFKETFKYNFFITNYYLTGGDGSFSDINASNITIKDSEGKSNVNPLLQVFGDISATGRLDANDGSFNLNVDISNKLIVEADISINNRLDAHDASFHNDVTIGNDLLVVGDVSINIRLDTHDASFQNDVTIANDLVVGNDVSINKHLSAYDASFRNNVTIAMDLVVGNDVSINNYLSAMDASFHHDVTIAKDLYVENDVSINHHLDAYDASFHNNVTIANDLVVENDVSINTFLSAIDTSFHHDVTIVNDLVVGRDVSINHNLDGYDASFHADVTIANDLVVENDVSINNFLSVMDASFHHDVTIANDLYVGRDVSINNFLSAMDSSFHRDVTIGKNLVVGRDVSINNRLDVYDASFQNNVTVAKDLLVINDVSINGILSVVDMSFDNYDVNVGNDISCGGVLKAPQVFAGTGPFTELDVLDSSYVFVGSNSNSDAVMRLDGTDGSGCEIVGSGSGDNRFGINIINATSKSDVLTISKEGNVGINNTSPTVNLDVTGSIAATDISGLGIIPIGGIIMWYAGTDVNVPYGWVLCAGGQAVNGVSIPDMRDKFVKGYNDDDDWDASGNNFVTFNNGHIPHTHDVGISGLNNYSHNHTDISADVGDSIPHTTHTHEFSAADDNVLTEADPRHDHRLRYDRVARVRNLSRGAAMTGTAAPIDTELEILSAPFDSGYNNVTKSYEAVLNLDRGSLATLDKETDSNGQGSNGAHTHEFTPPNLDHAGHDHDISFTKGDNDGHTHYHEWTVELESFTSPDTNYDIRPTRMVLAYIIRVY